MKKSNTTRTIKTANSYLVLDMITSAGKATIEEIVHSTHLSRPTILGILEDYLNNRIIVQAGLGESSVGRQPVLYALDTSMHFAIGIDFEFPPVHIVVTDLARNICYEKSTICSFNMDKNEIIQVVVKGIQDAINTMELQPRNIIGIGLGIPGTVNIKKNMSDTISRIPEWNKTPLSEILSSHFNVPVYVRNDAHLMALAARPILNLKEKNLIYIAYRTGIGSAVIRDGELQEWGYGNSGYIGHTTVDINGDLCSCGMRGCLETFASKPTIVNKYAQIKNLSEKPTFNEILALASAGDDIASELFMTAGMYFGLAIANAVKLLDIYTVVIDDLNCDSNHVFVRTVAKTVNRYCRSYALEQIRIIPNSLETSEYALGAALFILDTFFQKPELKLTL